MRFCLLFGREVMEREKGKERSYNDHPNDYSLAREYNVWGMLPTELTFQAEPCAARTAPTFI